MATAKKVAAKKAAPKKSAITTASEATGQKEIDRLARVPRKAGATTSAARASISATAAKRAAKRSRGSSWT